MNNRCACIHLCGQCNNLKQKCISGKFNEFCCFQNLYLNCMIDVFIKKIKDQICAILSIPRKFFNSHRVQIRNMALHCTQCLIGICKIFTRIRDVMSDIVTFIISCICVKCLISVWSLPICRVYFS